MPTESEAYNSNAIPAGSGYVKVYRGEAAPVLLGTYEFESADPTPEGKFIDRPSPDGGDGGWKLINGIKQGSATFQRATTATPHLQNGDFFKTSLLTVDSAGAGVVEYYVIASPSHLRDADYGKQSATIRQDKSPIAAVIAISEYA